VITLKYHLICLILLSECILGQQLCGNIASENPIVANQLHKSLLLWNIPVVFHVIKGSDGSGDVLDSQLISQIAVLNSGFSGFTFYLAGIRRIANDNWRNLSKDSSQEIDMKNMLAIDPVHAINIYITSIPGSIKGWATYPWDNSASQNPLLFCVVIRSNVLPNGDDPDNNLGRVASHEVGHYLGLYHTFDEYYVCKDGDLVADTPIHLVNTGCPSRNPDTCPQHPMVDPIENYMNYTNDLCRTEFSDGQSIRMNQIVQQYKPTIGGSTINFSTDLTIISGSTLQLSGNITCLFTSGKKIIVNGAFSSNNVIFTSTGTWGGIQFNSGASGTLSYCSIQNAQNGVYGNGYLPNITNSTIANNNIGINLYNTGVQTNSISNNTIQYNATHGINLTNSSPRNISGNQIYNNGQAGIYCINSSTPYIYNNQITGNSAAGITCALYSPARLGSYSGGGGYNLITGNNWGVGCGYESHAILGTTAGYGYNSIHSNTSHEVKSEYDSNVMAENNWWNRTTPPYYIASDFYTSYGGTIDYNPALSYNPLGGLMKTTSSEYNYDITNEEKGFSFLDSELKEALNNLIKGQYEEAILIYKQRYKKENDIGKKKYILGRLAECYNLSEEEGFIFFLNNEVRINSESELIRKDELYATSLFLENMFLINEKKYAQAVNNFEALLKDFPENETVVKPALFNLDCLSHNKLNDVSQGNIYLDLLKTKYPNDELTLQAMLTIGEFDKNYYSKPKLKKEGDVINELLSSYKLLGNYPNPFNPTTTISYIIPESGRVQIKIFDILGKEIATLYDGNNSAGKHSIVWDANSVANGIYFYSIVFNNQRLFKKMLLLK